MAQDELDPSSELDLVTLFRSTAVDAEMEATTIHNLLQANGIPSVLVGTATIPVLQFEVRVPEESLEEAQQMVASAEAAGPEAADEDEAASEQAGGTA
jgi:hypothetical protein